MKTTTSPHALLAIVCMLFFSCSQVDFDNTSVNNSEQSSTLQRFNVNIKTAQTFLDVLEKDKADTAKREIDKILPVAQYNDTLLYVVNYANDKGWIIISGDKRTESILASGDKGTFDLNSNNPGIATWIDQLAEQIYALKQNEEATSDTLSENYIFWSKIEEYESYKSGTSTLTKSKLRSAAIEDGYWELYNVVSQALPTTTKGPLLQTKWGQGAPWNTCVPYSDDYSSRCLTGCVAVAGSQTLYYLHSKLGVPATMWGTGVCNGWSGEDGHSYSFSFSNRSSSVWDAMDQARQWYLTTDSNGKPIWKPQETSGTNYVAILMGYVGWKVGMDYTADASGANTEDLVGLFSEEGVSSDYTDYNSSSVLTSLSKDIPVILSAYSTVHHVKFLGITLKTWYSDGHAWVADGYERRQTKYIYYYEWVKSDGTNSALKATHIKDTQLTKTEESISTSNLLIMNWGWNGGYDSGRYTLTGDWNSDNYNFIYKRSMILNFAKK